MPKKLDQFIDREAEEGSSDDDEPEAKRQKQEVDAKETAELKQLREEVEERERLQGGIVGARRMDNFLDRWEDIGKQQEQEDRY